jgi:phospholipase A1
MRKTLLLLVLINFSYSFSFGQNALNNSSESLTERWRINYNKDKNFKIVPYKPVYFLIGNYTSDVNNKPTSLNPLNTITDATNYSNWELKFQLSFKARVAKAIFNKFDLWAAYTQSSRWQVYSGSLSRPFRETNYEPEFIAVIPASYQFFGLKGVYVGVGLNHQSNGNSNPYSRSWNRVIIQSGWENENWSVVLKPWFRIQEKAIDDNNPGIENYVGRMEFLSAYSKGKHDFSLILRHSLRTGNNSGGSVRVDYAIVVNDFLQIHTQVFHGYGESLIDYNHKQTTFGIGLSLLQWR